MLSLAVSVGLTAAPSASAATWLEASDYLYYPPHNFGNVCRSRHIDLDAGSYEWQL